MSLLSMVKGFINKITGKTALQAELDRVNALRTIKVDTTKEQQAKKDMRTADLYETMPWADLNRYKKDVIDTWLAEIQEEIFSKGYKAIPEILNQYRIEMIQHFVLMQKLALGSYAPELDNLDAYPRADLIQFACELNQLSYEKRMTEQGKADVSKAQTDLLAKNGVTAVPKNRFEASRMIDAMLKSKGVDTSKPYSNNATDAQINRINSMSKLLGTELAVTKELTKKEASAKIEELQKELDSKPELIPAISVKQFDTLAKLTKQLGKRMTAKKEASFKALTMLEASKLISDMSKEYSEKHPEASEGQVSYIVTLCGILNLPYNIEDIKALTKGEATAKIKVLRGEHLYVLTRKTSPSITKEDIKAMSDDAVKKMIDQIREENKSRDYKEFPEER